VAAAGSRIGSRTYSLVADVEPAELPAWLARLVARPAAPGRRHGWQVSRARGYVAAALEGEVRRVLEAGPGRRNDALNRAAWSLGRFVAAGVLDRHVVEDALFEAAAGAGYRDGPRAAARVVAAALDARTRGARQ
jgi:hypothetical protein